VKRGVRGYAKQELIGRRSFLGKEWRRRRERFIEGRYFDLAGPKSINGANLKSINGVEGERKSSSYKPVGVGMFSF
jgi:hypothetical protein